MTSSSSTRNIHTGRQKSGCHPILKNKIYDPHMNIGGQKTKYQYLSSMKSLCHLNYFNKWPTHAQVGMCAKNCVCQNQNMGYTEMCGCHGLAECGNTLTHEQVICGDEEDIWVAILSFHSICPHSIFFLFICMSQIICMVCKLCHDF